METGSAIKRGRGREKSINVSNKRRVQRNAKNGKE